MVAEREGEPSLFEECGPVRARRFLFPCAEQTIQQPQDTSPPHKDLPGQMKLYVGYSEQRELDYKH